jgi:hypothetical protein
MSKICAPLNFTSRHVKFVGAAQVLQLAMKVVQHNASPINLHFNFDKYYQDHDLLRHIHEVTPLQLVLWIKANILTMYMPLSMDTFHPSLSTKTSGGTIFKRLGSFYFVNNFKCPTYGTSSIWVLVVLGGPKTNKKQLGPKSILQVL